MRGFRAYRHVAGDASLTHDRRGVGTDPIMVAIATAIFDESSPRASSLQGLPHVGEGLRRHIGVTHEVVRLTQQFLATETADGDEGGIGIGDVALRIGGRHQGHPIGKLEGALGDGKIVLHGDMSPERGCRGWQGRVETRSTAGQARFSRLSQACEKFQAGMLPSDSAMLRKRGKSRTSIFL